MMFGRSHSVFGRASKIPSQQISFHGRRLGNVTASRVMPATSRLPSVLYPGFRTRASFSSSSFSTNLNKTKRPSSAELATSVTHPFASKAGEVVLRIPKWESVATRSRGADIVKGVLLKGNAASGAAGPNGTITSGSVSSERAAGNSGEGVASEHDHMQALLADEFVAPVGIAVEYSNYAERPLGMVLRPDGKRKWLLMTDAGTLKYAHNRCFTMQFPPKQDGAPYYTTDLKYLADRSGAWTKHRKALAETEVESGNPSSTLTQDLWRDLSRKIRPDQHLPVVTIEHIREWLKDDHERRGGGEQTHLHEMKGHTAPLHDHDIHHRDIGSSALETYYLHRIFADDFLHFEPLEDGDGFEVRPPKEVEQIQLEAKAVTDLKEETKKEVVPPKFIVRALFQLCATDMLLPGHVTSRRRQAVVDEEEGGNGEKEGESLEENASREESAWLGQKSDTWSSNIPSILEDLEQERPRQRNSGTREERGADKEASVSPLDSDTLSGTTVNPIVTKLLESRHPMDDIIDWWCRSGSNRSEQYIDEADLSWDKALEENALLLSALTRYTTSESFPRTDIEQDLLNPLGREMTQSAAQRLLVDLGVWGEYHNRYTQNSPLKNAFEARAMADLAPPPEAEESSDGETPPPPPPPPSSSRDAAGVLIAPRHLDPLSETYRDVDEEIRVDLTHLDSFTIDGKGTRDVDDAVSIETLPDGTRWVYVHVADPTSFVPMQIGTPYDLHSRHRLETVYLPEGPVSMIPDSALSVLSLLPNKAVNRAFTFAVKVDDKAIVLDYKVQPSYIGPAKPITYREVDDIIGEDDGDLEVNAVEPATKSKKGRQSKVVLAPNQKQMLLDLYDIGTRRLAWRKERGASTIILPSDGVSVRYTDGEDVPTVHLMPQLHTHSPARLLIQEAMIMAGEAAAKTATDNGLSLPFRGQERPDVPSYLQQSFLDATGGSFKAALKQEQIAHFDVPLFDYGNIVRYLPRASYSADPMYHYSMALPEYARATSPIRRYQDVVVHSQLKALARKEPLPFEKDDIARMIPEMIKTEGRIKDLNSRSQHFWRLMYLKQQPEQRVYPFVITEKYEEKCSPYARGLSLEYGFTLSQIPQNGSTRVGDVVLLNFDKIFPHDMRCVVQNTRTVGHGAEASKQACDFVRSRNYRTGKTNEDWKYPMWLYQRYTDGLHRIIWGDEPAT